MLICFSINFPPDSLEFSSVCKNYNYLSSSHLESSVRDPFSEFCCWRRHQNRDVTTQLTMHCCSHPSSFLQCSLSPQHCKSDIYRPAFCSSANFLFFKSVCTVLVLCICCKILFSVNMKMPGLGRLLSGQSTCCVSMRTPIQIPRPLIKAQTQMCVCVEPQGLGLGGWAEMHKSQGVSLWWANLADTGSSRSERDPDLDSKVGEMGELQTIRWGRWGSLGCNLVWSPGTHRKLALAMSICNPKGQRQADPRSLLADSPSRYGLIQQRDPDSTH